tara:strand:+ start:178 stop:720 length:543 start_codon:yes stop_codon:yes gene_type:complete
MAMQNGRPITEYEKQRRRRLENPDAYYDKGGTGLGMPYEMYPARQNPNVRWSYGDQGWKTGLPDAAGVDPTPFYSGSYTTTDPSFGDWRMQGPESDLQQGFSAGEYFDPTNTNPYTRGQLMQPTDNRQLSEFDIMDLEADPNYSSFLTRMPNGELVTGKKRFGLTGAQESMDRITGRKLW